MGLSASQARQLLLTAKRNDLEFRAQQISQQRLVLSSQLEEIAAEYERATSNRQMRIQLYVNGAMENDNKISTVTNLTYKALVSGCSLIGSASKLAIPKEDGAMVATTPYVVKNADGAIVVSDLSEIPGVGAWGTSYEKYDGDLPKNAQDAKEKYYYKENGEYKEYRVFDDDGTKATQKFYKPSEEGEYVYVKNKKSLEEYDSSKKEHQEATHRFDVVGKDEKNIYVEKNNGSISNSELKELKLAVKNPEDGTAKAYNGNCKIYTTKSGTIKVETTNDDGETEVAEYVLDENLKLGSTDQYSSSGGGPNYMQEMLRNGVYTLERYNRDQEKWSPISWDAAVGIEDRYYTEDDDAAKAKYDRLQNEIQRQDKKLELELDNIETQRSAITTEEESVQKVMDDNIEGTFKTFA